MIFVPGSVIGLIPWLLSRWRVTEPFLGWMGLRWLGVILILLGIPALGEAMARFVRDGHGTPAPIMPTEHLVVTGPYRCVRNPMYISVVAMILGQGLYFGSQSVVLYAVFVALGFHVFVRVYEEPTLRRRYGAEYEAYAREVHRWRPRLVPWAPHR